MSEAIRRQTIDDLMDAWRVRSISVRSSAMKTEAVPGAMQNAMQRSNAMQISLEAWCRSG